MSNENRQKSSSAQLKTARILAALTFACFLPYAIDKGLSYPYDFQNGAHAGILELTTPRIAARRFNVVAEGPTFNAATGSSIFSINYLLFPLDLTAAIQPNSFNIYPPAPRIGSLQRETNSHAIQSPAQLATSYGSALIETEAARITLVQQLLPPWRSFGFA